MANEPLISVDTKKKELIGEFKNRGKDLSLKKQPIEVRMHNFLDPDFGKKFIINL
jgi:hypothetical protein